MAKDSGDFGSLPDLGAEGGFRIILNPEAGGVRRRPELVRALEERYGPALARTEAPGHATELARRARADGCRTVVAAGGDGTIHEVVNGLVDPAPSDPSAGRDAGVPRLGVLPLGTGNDLARALDVPLDPEVALRRLPDARVRRIDLVLLEAGTRRLVVNFVIGGFGGDVSRHITEERRARWGGLIYLRAAVAEMSGLTSYRAQIRVDDEALGPLDLLAVIVGNGRFLGNGIPATPAASLDDGRLDVVVVPSVGPLRLPLVVGRVLAGRHLGHRSFLFRRSRRVEIRAEPRLPLNADGQSLGRTDAKLEVVPGALPVLAAPSSVQPSGG